MVPTASSHARVAPELEAATPSRTTSSCGSEAWICAACRSVCGAWSTAAGGGAVVRSRLRSRPACAAGEGSEAGPGRPCSGSRSCSCRPTRPTRHTMRASSASSCCRAARPGAQPRAGARRESVIFCQLETPSSLLAPGKAAPPTGQPVLGSELTPAWLPRRAVGQTSCRRVEHPGLRILLSACGEAGALASMRRFSASRARCASARIACGPRAWSGAGSGLGLGRRPAAGFAIVSSQSGRRSRSARCALPGSAALEPEDMYPTPITCRSSGPTCVSSAAALRDSAARLAPCIGVFLVPAAAATCPARSCGEEGTPGKRVWAAAGAEPGLSPG